MSTSTIKLVFGATTTETNFLYYKIYYKAGTAGVAESDSPHNDSDLNNINFNFTGSTTVEDLNPDTDYVFKIWAYDQYGNKASSTEVIITTNGSLTNDSLAFTNPYSDNYVIANGTSEWNFQAQVSELNGWHTLDNIILRLADKSDDSPQFSDLEFSWNQNTQNFSKTGADALNAVALSGNSTSTCAVNICTLDFKLIFNYNFASSSWDYDAELYSTNDSAAYDEDTYIDIYQTKVLRVEQIHYRWRNDDGGE